MLQLLEAAFELHSDLHAIQETLLRDFDVLAPAQWPHGDNVVESRSLPTLTACTSSKWPRRKPLPSGHLRLKSLLRVHRHPRRYMATPIPNSHLHSSNQPLPLEGCARRCLLSRESPRCRFPSRKWPGSGRAPIAKGPSPDGTGTSAVLTNSRRYRALGRPAFECRPRRQAWHHAERRGRSLEASRRFYPTGSPLSSDRGSNEAPPAKRAPPTVLSVPLHPSLADERHRCSPSGLRLVKGRRVCRLRVQRLSVNLCRPVGIRLARGQRLTVFESARRAGMRAGPSAFRRRGLKGLVIKGGILALDIAKTSRRWKRTHDAVNNMEISMEKIALARRMVRVGSARPTTAPRWRRERWETNQ